MGFNAFKPAASTPPRKGEYCLTTKERPPYCTDMKSNTPNYPGKTDPLPPNTGNNGPPRVSPGKATWFNNGKPMSPGSKPGWTNNAGTSGSYGNKAAQSGGTNIGNANRLEGNSGVRHHATIATGISVFLAVFLALFL